MRAPFLLRRMASAWLLLAAFMVTVFVAAALLAALASFNAQVLPQAARRQLTAASGQTGVVISGAVDASVAAADQSAVRGALASAFGSAPYHLDSALWSNPLGLPRAAGSRVIPLAEAAAPTHVRQHATLVSGAWPGSPVPGQPVPVAVPAVAAAQLGLKPGDVVAVRDRDNGRRGSLRVTGVFALRDPASTYWGLDQVGTSGISTAPGYVTYGPFVVSPAAFGPGGLTVGEASWAAALEPARIQGSQISDLGARISYEARYLQDTVRLGGLQVSTGLPALLAGLNRALAVARSLLVISALQLLLLAAAALILVSRLLTSHRSAENALLSSRGATSWQLAGITLTETLVLAAVAAAAGAVAGTRLAALLGQAGALRADRLVLAGFPASVWLAVALMLVLCLVIAVWPALRPASPGADAVRRGRQATVAGIARSGADVALIVLALIALRELRSYSAVARLPAGGLGLDPVLTAAPALALAAASLVLLRLLPVVARLLERLVARSRRLGGALASWEISRRAVTQSGPVLLAVLAVATGTLTLAQYQSWRQSAHDQAAFAAGADVRVNTAGPLSMAQAGAIGQARGVTAAMPVSEQGGSRGTLLAIDARQAGSTALLRPDLSPLPAARLWRLLAPPAAAGVALP
ncbi:MAG: FtsX-like permease family protein, partial [Streptosporangiaceae bacterium]